MCGRTACTLCPTELRRACRYKDTTSGVDKQPEWIDSGKVYNPSHNVCPTDVTPVLVSGAHFKSTEPRALVPMIWGMIPPWHKGDIKSHGLTTHNCRLEGVASSKLYQEPLFSSQRCVIICNGFYEWQTTKGKGHKQPYFIYHKQDEGTTKGKGHKQPYFIYHKQDEGVSILDAESLKPAGEDDTWNGPTLLHIAGLFSSLKTEAGDLVYSYSMITMESNDHFSWLHHRMPAILESEHMVQDWLDKKVSSKQAVSMLKKVSCLSWHRVATLVNNSRNKDTKCNKPLDFRGPNAIATNNPLLNWLQKGATPKRPAQTSDLASTETETQKKPKTS